MLLGDPTVSIFINCKNGAQSVRRSIEGALGQTYPHVELVFQDGGSTDGTLGIVHEYMKKYPGRIRLNHELDSCPEEGFFRALKACQGDIIGSSMADEELLPEAVAWAVEHFKSLPEAGAIYGDQPENSAPASEEIPHRPISPYGVAKATGELYLHYYKMVHSLNYVALRYGNVYGPRQDPFGESPPGCALPDPARPPATPRRRPG